MASATWPQAVGALLSHYGLSAEGLPASDNPKDLKKHFAGSGIAVLAMKGAQAALGADFDGVLLKQEDGSYLAACYEDGQAHLLSAEGKSTRVVTQEDLTTVRQGWIFRKKDRVNDDVLAFYRRYKRPVLQILACGLIVNLFGLCLPIFASFVYDKVLGNNIHETLWALAIGLLVVAVIDFSVRSVRVLLAERFALTSEADIDHHIFQGLLGSDTQSLPSMGRFLDRYKRILSSRDLLSSSYLLALVDIPFLLLFLIAIAAVAGWLVVIPLLLGGLMLLANAITALPSYDYDRQSRKTDESRFRLLTDLLASHEAIVGSALGKEMAARWRVACAQTSSHQSLSRYWKSMGATFSNSFSFLSYIFVIVGGAYMVDAHLLTSGGLLAVSMLSSRVISSFSSVVTIVIRAKDFRISLKEMNAILHAPAKARIEKIPDNLRGVITFNNVTCTLGETKKPVLAGVSLRIDHGEMVGIAGIPGSGKTTLLRLIGGLVKPQTGEVLIDHYPVSSLRPADLASTVGYKPQDLCLVEGSIESNIRAGTPPLTPEEREAVLGASGLGWMFQQGGLNWATEVGGRGAFLSGGQRQLVALARAVLRERPILLLDEPTNGLDVQLEAHLAKYLASLKGRCTILICSHSRHLLSACDRIIAVGDGRILADGPREKILVA